MKETSDQQTRIPIENVLGNIPLVILVLDKELRVVYGNISNGHMTKGPFHDLAGFEPGEDYNTFVIGKDSQLRHIVERTMESGEGQSSIEIIHGDKSSVFKTIHVSTVYLKADSLVIALLQDVTESRLDYSPGIEKKKLSEMLDETGRICHKINQPLQVASGSLDLALLMNEGSEKDRELITEARNQMGRVADIVREMMSLRSIYLRDTGK